MEYPTVYSGNLSRTIRLSDRVYCRLGNLPVRDQCNTGILLAEDGILLVDYPAQQPEHEIIDEVEGFFGLPVTHILITHAHGDHRNGLESLHRPEILLVGSRETLAELEQVYPRLPNPSLATTGGEVMVIGGISLAFSRPPTLPAHSPWDVGVLLPEEQLAFLGDFLNPPEFLYFHSSNIGNWLEGLALLPAMLEGWTLVMGHGVPTAFAKAFVPVQDYMTRLRELFVALSPDCFPLSGDFRCPDESRPLWDHLASITDNGTVRRQLSELHSSRNAT